MKENEYYLVISGKKVFVESVKDILRKTPTNYGYIKVDDKQYLQTIPKHSRRGKLIQDILIENENEIFK